MRGGRIQLVAWLPKRITVVWSEESPNATPTTEAIAEEAAESAAPAPARVSSQMELLQAQI